jgi:hypothetical protein
MGCMRAHEQVYARVVSVVTERALCFLWCSLEPKEVPSGMSVEDFLIVHSGFKGKKYRVLVVILLMFKINRKLLQCHSF